MEASSWNGTRSLGSCDRRRKAHWSQSPVGRHTVLELGHTHPHDRVVTNWLPFSNWNFSGSCLCLEMHHYEHRNLKPSCYFGGDSTA